MVGPSTASLVQSQAWRENSPALPKKADCAPSTSRSSGQAGGREAIVTTDVDSTRWGRQFLLTTKNVTGCRPWRGHHGFGFLQRGRQARLSGPSRVGVVGDGGFQMTLSELPPPP